MREPSAEQALNGLHRYFLLNYREEARRRHPELWDLYPLASGSRLDVVQVNDGRRAHFFYSRRRRQEHVAFIHHVDLGGADGGRSAEKTFLAHQFDGPDTLLHFVVDAPFQDEFDRIDRLARDTVADHARLVRPAP